MENLEIIVLTSIICTLFAIFIIGPLFYAHTLEKNRLNPQENAPGDQPPRRRKLSGFSFLKLSRSITEDESLSRKNKKDLVKVIQRTISDMESDGIYFSSEIKEELKKQREEICEYSGLPSVKSYERNKINSK